MSIQTTKKEELSPPPPPSLHFLLPCSSSARLLSFLLSSHPSISSFWTTGNASQLQATCMTPLRGQVICLETLDQASASATKKPSRKQCRRVAVENSKPFSGSSYYSLLLKNIKRKKFTTYQSLSHPTPPYLHLEACLLQTEHQQAPPGPLTTHSCSTQSKRPASFTAKSHLQDLFPKGMQRTGPQIHAQPKLDAN